MKYKFKVEKCKWKNDSISPVVLMIDDLANKAINIKNTEEVIAGSDWGYHQFSSNSFWEILNKELINNYPYIKITMFLVVGRREGIKKHGNKYVSYTIKENNFDSFLKEISKNEQFELAYHGLTHGICGDEIGEFIEEWNTFENINEAIQTINLGKKMYEEAVGKSFTGGKYCGYLYNDFSDKSISQTGFKWWCRHWDSVLLQNNQHSDILSLDLEYFDDVIDIPSTIDGSFYSLKIYKKIFTKKYAKSIYYKLFKNSTLESQIQSLLNNRQIISIQEHSAKYRVDDRVQYPNIVTDIENLNYIFKYLKKYDLWYATCGEIADYYRAYTKCNIQLKDNSIIVECEDEVEGFEISIALDSDFKNKCILTTENKIIEGVSKHNKYIFNIKLYNNKIYNIKLID